MVLNAILAGAIAMASLIVALLFLRFWRSTHDRFFLYFALSFAIEGVDRILLAMMSSETEDAPLFYLIRLVAYGLILIAIFEKNRRRPESTSPDMQNDSPKSSTRK